MRRVTKENLIAQIDRLYKIKDEQGQLSMSSEYTLQAYEMLLAMMEAEPVVPDVMEPTIEAIKRILPTSNPDEYAACIGADMWNACRAAMLNQK